MENAEPQSMPTFVSYRPGKLELVRIITRFLPAPGQVLEMTYLLHADACDPSFARQGLSEVYRAFRLHGK